jgi:hypothetical protein
LLLFSSYKSCNTKNSNTFSFYYISVKEDFTIINDSILKFADKVKGLGGVAVNSNDKAFIDSIEVVFNRMTTEPQNGVEVKSS